MIDCKELVLEDFEVKLILDVLDFLSGGHDGKGGSIYGEYDVDIAFWNLEKREKAANAPFGFELH